MSHVWRSTWPARKHARTPGRGPERASRQAGSGRTSVAAPGRAVGPQGPAGLAAGPQQSIAWQAHVSPSHRVLSERARAATHARAATASLEHPPGQRLRPSTRYQALSPGEHIGFPGLSCVRTPIVERWSPVPSAGRRSRPRLRRSPGRRRSRTASSGGSATMLARPPARDGEQARLRVVVAGRAVEPVGRSRAATRSSTWRNGTSRLELAQHTDTARQGPVDQHVRRRQVQPSIAAYASPRGSLTRRNCSRIQARENRNFSTLAGSMKGPR